MKVPLWFIRLRSWEYWPVWVLYLPVIWAHLRCTFKTGSPFFFLNVNPGIDKGFILSDPKSVMLEKIPLSLLPKTIGVKPGTPLTRVMKVLRDKGLSFPLMVKPDIGYRGLKVRLIHHEAGLQEFLDGIRVNYLVQEYIDLPVELGIFWYRIPGTGRGRVPSLTLKSFLKVEGNGKSTVGALVMANPRWRLQYERLKRLWQKDWDRVLQHGESLLLEPVGNHNRGTMFLDGSHLIDERLLARTEGLADCIPGFHFGRFDIKVKSLEDFKNGGTVKILEVNGIGAEPTHVYQPGYSLWKAWKEMGSLWKIAAEIAAGNKRNGHRIPAYSEAKARYLQYLKYKRTALQG